MGREIRRVPKGWEHPRRENGKYIPLYDNDYETAADKWVADFLAWERGDDPDREKYQVRYFWDWNGGPPDMDSYRDKFLSEPDCFQIYETVSEGTPTSPVFETLGELIDWLVGEGYSREAAAGFATSGWAPSMMFTPQTGLIDGIASFGIKPDKQNKETK